MPSKSKAKYTNLIAVKVDDDALALVGDTAREYEVTVSHVVRQALKAVPTLFPRGRAAQLTARPRHLDGAHEAASVSGR
jgi:hypothetical protein